MMQYHTYYNVDSFLFVVYHYQFAWISWVKVNHEFKCSTNYECSVCRLCQTMKSNINQNAMFPKMKKIDIHENK